MRAYTCLHTNEFRKGDYTLVPIRDEDKYSIMQWRNEQIDILRQQAPLTKEQQEHYFKKTIAALFEEEQPRQLLWSFLHKGKLIGYGGLVHINWENKTGEISFLTETSRNRTNETVISDWKMYLSILKEIAKAHLHFKNIYTYAYDIRPHLYIALEESGFKETKRIKNAIEINGKQVDVVIHTFYCSDLEMRFANESDVELYYKWANDPLVRNNSFNTAEIDHAQHVSWFNNKLRSEDCFFYFFSDKAGQPVGQVRIDRSGNETVIGISVDENYRGKGLGAEMLDLSCADYLQKFQDRTIVAYIKENNIASLNQFKKAGFSEMEKVLVSGVNSYRLKRSIQ